MIPNMCRSHGFWGMCSSSGFCHLQHVPTLGLSQKPAASRASSRAFLLPNDETRNEVLCQTLLSRNRQLPKSIIQWFTTTFPIHMAICMAHFYWEPITLRPWQAYTWYRSPEASQKNWSQVSPLPQSPLAGGILWPWPIETGGLPIPGYRHVEWPSTFWVPHFSHPSVPLGHWRLVSCAQSGNYQICMYS